MYYVTYKDIFSQNKMYFLILWRNMALLRFISLINFKI